MATHVPPVLRWLMVNQKSNSAQIQYLFPGTVRYPAGANVNELKDFFFGGGEVIPYRAKTSSAFAVGPEKVTKPRL